MERRTILHIIDTLGIGGAEMLLRNTLQLLPEYHHCVVCLSRGTSHQELESATVEVVCLEHEGWKSFFSSVRKLRRIITKVKPVIVHTHLFYATLLARVAVPFSIPLVTTLHSTFSRDAFEKNRKSVWAERMTLRQHHILIGVSQYVLNDYLQWIPFKGRRFVLYN
ncbi:MAG TPA: glycosyltransferase, partial [Flavisolibacter sp.]|nr:glycosyltransferase [Flavisolibacter sp.]